MRRDAGVTLLELVAVLAVYGIVAVLSLQLLSGAMLSRERTAAARAETAEAAAVLAVMRRDLEQLAPVASGSEPVFRLDPGRARFATAGGPGAFAAPRAIAWRHDADTRRLVREGDGVAQVMLEGVGALAFRVSDGPGGWRDGPGWRGAGPADLPRGIEARIETDALGPLRLVVAR